MAYTPGFEIDVFISYAHRNNESGWVTQFREFLQQRVPEFLPHTSQVEVWKDDTLSGFDTLWPTLQRNIESSALFISVCSPVYVTSANCAKEVEHFLGHNPEPTRMDRSSRMARVAIIPYATVAEALPPFRRDDTVYYRFYEELAGGTIEQFEAASERFRKEADRVAQHIAGQLRRLRQVAERNGSRAGGGKRKALFVASTSKDRADHRLTLVNELKDHEVLTVPDGSYGHEELTTLTNDLLARSECSVHLLGERPGPSTDEGDVAMSHLQYRLARAHRPPRFTQLVWAPASLQLPVGTQREFVEDVRAFKPAVWDAATEVLCGTFDDLLRGVQGVLTRDAPAETLGSAGPLYLLCTKADLDQADGNLMRLRDSLLQAGVLPELPAFDDQDVDLAELERSLIAQSRGTLIYYGRGGDGWVKLKRQTLLRVLGDLKAQDQHVRAVYLSEPANPQKHAQYMGLGSGAFTEAKGFPPLLLLGNAGSFQPDFLKPLLEQFGGAPP